MYHQIMLVIAEVKNNLLSHSQAQNFLNNFLVQILFFLKQTSLFVSMSTL